MTPFQYDEELVTKTLRSGVVYDKYALSDMFTECANVSIRHSIR